MSDLTPTEGARYLFERVRADDAAAEYALTIFTPSEQFTGRARLAADGTVALEAAAPPELVSTAETFAKLVARSADKQREQGLPPWPARVLRWRGPGRGRQSSSSS